MRRGVALACIVAAPGCHSRSAIMVDAGPSASAPDAAGVDPSSGPCNLTIRENSTITVQGWCLRDPGRMTVDGEAITVISQAADGVPATLVRIDKSTGAQSILVGKAGDPAPDGTLADGGSELFFAGCDAGKHCAIFALPRGGGSPRTVADSDATVANTFNAVFDLAVDATNVYWLTDGIWSAPRAGGAAKRLGDGVVLADRFFASIAVDASAVYATRPTDGIVIRQPLDGAAASPLATGQRTPSRIVVAGDTIYWTEWGTRGVDCTSSDGTLDAWSSGAEKPLVNPIAGPRDFTVVAGKIVYSSLGSFCNVITSPIGSISALSLSTSASVEVAAAQLQPANVVSDGSQVYWTVASTWDATGAVLHAPLP